jgi:hypothetical protein
VHLALVSMEALLDEADLLLDDRDLVGSRELEGFLR